jgi:hypothetical protein
MMLAEILFHAAFETLDQVEQASRRTGEKSSSVASMSVPITGWSATRTTAISAQVKRSMADRVGDGPIKGSPFF